MEISQGKGVFYCEGIVQDYGRSGRGDLDPSDTLTGDQRGGAEAEDPQRSRDGANNRYGVAPLTATSFF